MKEKDLFHGWHKQNQKLKHFKTCRKSTVNYESTSLCFGCELQGETEILPYALLFSMQGVIPWLATGRRSETTEEDSRKTESCRCGRKVCQTHIRTPGTPEISAWCQRRQRRQQRRSLWRRGLRHVRLRASRMSQLPLSGTCQLFS